MDPKVFDFEIGVPVSGPIAPPVASNRAICPPPRWLARSTSGPYEGLSGAWGELAQWIKAEGLAEAAELLGMLRQGPRVQFRACRLAD